MQTPRSEKNRDKPGAHAVQLAWDKPQQGWHKLLELDLAAISGYGVYVIWHGGFPGRTVKVWHGDIKRQLTVCRRDERVGAFGEFGPLFVTWAIADASGAAGMARHLADTLRPLIEDGAADVHRIVANSPF